MFSSLIIGGLQDKPVRVKGPVLQGAPAGYAWSPALTAPAFQNTLLRRPGRGAQSPVRRCQANSSGDVYSSTMSAQAKSQGSSRILVYTKPLQDGSDSCCARALYLPQSSKARCELKIQALLPCLIRPEKGTRKPTQVSSSFSVHQEAHRWARAAPVTFTQLSAASRPVAGVCQKNKASRGGSHLRGQEPRAHSWTQLLPELLTGQKTGPLNGPGSLFSLFANQGRLNSINGSLPACTAETSN